MKPLRIIGGGGIYKNSSNKGSIIYLQTSLIHELTDFTIYFWQKDIDSGTILNIADNISHITGIIINNHGIWKIYDNRYYCVGDFSLNKSIWSFCEYTFKQSSSSKYIVTGFYQGEKKFSSTEYDSFIKKSYIILGSNASNSDEKYEIEGFTGSIYDFSIYDGILHTENYNEFPKREMNYHPNIRYAGMEKENNLYGMI